MAQIQKKLQIQKQFNYGEPGCSLDFTISEDNAEQFKKLLIEATDDVQAFVEQIKKLNT